MSVKCWIVIYFHRYGTDAWPIFATRRPSKTRVLKDIGDWEGDDRDDEWYEIVGPWRLP